MFELCADEVAAGGFDAVDGLSGVDWIRLGHGLSMNRKIYLLYLGLLGDWLESQLCAQCYGQLAVSSTQSPYTHLRVYIHCKFVISDNPGARLAFPEADPLLTFKRHLQGLGCCH